MFGFGFGFGFGGGTGCGGVIAPIFATALASQRKKSIFATGFQKVD